jgi:hypothetical protein
MAIGEDETIGCHDNPGTGSTGEPAGFAFAAGMDGQPHNGRADTVDDVDNGA